MGALDRLKYDTTGNKVMVPVNVEGVTDDGGLTMKQAIALGAVLFLGIVDYLAFKDRKLTVVAWVLNIAVYLFIAQLVIRKFVFNENYLMREMKSMEAFKNCSPAMTWSIAAIDATNGVMQFNDGRVALMVSLEQATIIGREAQYRGTHYSSISDFYRVLNQNNIQWVRLNIMKNAKNDKRLSVLTDVVNKCEIESIREATRQHLGYMRAMEIRTLYETEYFMLIASASMGALKLFDIANEALDNLDDAAYNTCQILGRDEIYDLASEFNGVKYFDAGEVMRDMARRNSVVKHLLNITEIEFIGELPESEIDKAKWTASKAERKPNGNIVVQFDDMSRNKLNNKISRMQSGELGDGDLEKAMLLKKVPVAKANTDKKEEETAQETGMELEFDMFGSDDIVDANALAEAERAEAMQINSELGQEELNRQLAIKKAKKMRWKEAKELAEKKKKEEEENRKRIEKEREEARKLKEMEEARKVQVDDFIDE